MDADHPGNLESFARCFTYEAPHPLHREPIDRRLDDDYMKMLTLSMEGFAILGALLQALIEKKIPIVAFEERIVAASSTTFIERT